MSETSPRERADKRYSIDYRGVFLNAAISVFSSVTATGFTSFFTNTPPSQLPFVALAIFFAQVVPKVLIELHKSYLRAKYKSEGFYEGITTESKKKLKPVERAVSFCEHAAYY
jgi:hypothetical protein